MMMEFMLTSKSTQKHTLDIKDSIFGRLFIRRIALKEVSGKLCVVKRERLIK
jgi:hypothetical protein